MRKTKHAEGGIAGMLGEPRSGYNEGGYMGYWKMVQDKYYEVKEIDPDKFGKMSIQDFAKKYFPRPGQAEGGRIGLAEGDTPSQAWMRDYFYDAGYDDLGVITLHEYMNGPIGKTDYANHGPGKAEGGRIGYDNGGPVDDGPPATKDSFAMNIFSKPYDELTEIQQIEIDDFFSFVPEKAEGGRIGFKDGEGIMSRTGDMVDMRNIPYYAGKGLQGLVNSAETLSKFPFAAGELGSKLIQQPPKKEMFMKAIEDITPGSWSENLGLTSLVEGMAEKRPDDAKTVGNVLGLGTEVAVPTGGAFKAGQFLLSKVSKLMGKVKDGKTLNKLVDEKLTDAGQSRRDFNLMAVTAGISAALTKIGLGGLLKGATKKLDDIEIQVRGDADYEYVDEAWSGSTWANVYFKALTKKGQKILDDLVKEGDTGYTLQSNVEEGKDLLTSLTKQDGLYVPGGGSEEAAWIVEKIIAKHKPNWRLNTATTQVYNPATKSFAHPKGSVKEAYETTKNYSGKDLNKKTIMKEADDLIASEPGPYHTKIEVRDEYLDDILDQITTKKAEGGRIGLGAGGPPLQLGIAESEWKAKHPVQGNKISKLKDAAMDRAFPGTGITGSLNMGNFEAFYNQPLIDPMNMFEKSGEPQYGLQYEKGPFSAGVGVMPDGETEYGFKFRKEFNDGGLTKTIPPERGPDPQGLPSALYNGIMRPRSY